MGTSKIDGRIYADLNRWFNCQGSKHWVTLDRRGTIRDLDELQIELEEHLILPLWMDDADEEGLSDPLLFEGVVHFDADRSEWVAIVDWDEVRHASDEM